ncbi:glycosyltransferase family 2 protein [Enterocloster bolteae]|uniref:glycosyltransferase family 2 protein n=1 Tax=Enterocloster bolteae TaxID=208479 RepID=UPI00189D3BD6|nr:glycosyltransferase family 2 protein [Enterocloster bolteae]
MLEKVSIIVPVYNTRKEYLKMCIESLISQTYHNIEIIVVNDGSRKECVIQYNSIVALDNRIKIINKKNGGVSSARNFGMEEATGHYIAFVDSDDWVDRYYIESLVAGLESSEVSLSICNMAYENKSKIISKHEKYLVMKYSKGELFEKLLCSNEIGGFLCNKLFIKKLITQRMDESLYYCEDFVFTAKYSENIRYASFTKAQLYHYRQEQGNATTDFTYNSRIYSLLKSYDYIKKIYEINEPQYVPMIEKNILKIALNLRARYKLSKSDCQEQYRTILKTIGTYMYTVMFNNKISFLEKINIIMTWMFPRVFFRLKNKFLGRRIN